MEWITRFQETLQPILSMRLGQEAKIAIDRRCQRRLGTLLTEPPSERF